MSLTSRIRLFFDNIEQYVVSYTPLRITMYDSVTLTQKFNVFKRLIRTVTSFGG